MNDAPPQRHPQARRFGEAQRIVLRGTAWNVGRHLPLHFPTGARPLSFLNDLWPEDLPPTHAAQARARLQISLGFSRRGLERLGVPRHVIASFAAKAPAFHAGAARRAVGVLGASGVDAPACWDRAFGAEWLDAVLSLHAMEEGEVDTAFATIQALARRHGVVLKRALPIARRLPAPGTSIPSGGPPPGVPSRRPVAAVPAEQQWTHFGFRDGLSRVLIRGWHDETEAPGGAARAGSIHQPGEFLLGHPQDAGPRYHVPDGQPLPRDAGANPWLVGPPGARVWPEELRAFFRDGSFGVFQRIEQHVEDFERFVAETVERQPRNRTGPRPGALDAESLMAKLCGRTLDGRALGAPDGTPPEHDFDYATDPEGHRCPFGSHVRRMNPRGDALAHGARTRALLRRGMPYGRRAEKDLAADRERGLYGHFFCASLEDQYEHLVAHWAETVPLGSADTGGARDPLTGAHASDDGPFAIPGPGGTRWIDGLRPFVRTRGIAYLFYPSLPTLEGIARNALWGALTREDR